jgi:hypothetical protein
MSVKCPINPITDPNTAYSHTYKWQYSWYYYVKNIYNNIFDTANVIYVIQMLSTYYFLNFPYTFSITVHIFCINAFASQCFPVIGF